MDSYIVSYYTINVLDTLEYDQISTMAFQLQMKFAYNMDN